MTTLHPTSAYNVHATLRQWFAERVAAFELPPYLPSVSVVVDAPDIEPNLPAISLFTLSTMASDRYQGRGAEEGVKTLKMTGMLDVSAWVTRKALWNGRTCWEMQLNALHSFILDTLTANPTVMVTDAYTDYDNPVAVPYKIDLKNPNTVQAAHDPNPDIERVRVLVTYSWHMRSAN